jgi:hypothetical protein
VAKHLARALRAALALALIGALVGCDVQMPSSGGTVSLPKEFPADFPIPPRAKLLLASGPFPFMPPELRGMTVQWSSTLSRAELESFYSSRHAAWRLNGAPITPPTAGPVSLGTLFVLWHEGDGISATVSVGASNMIDSGILVQATIIPARSSPPPP